MLALDVGDVLGGELTAEMANQGSKCEHLIG
jgi:hypothetical protein